jgi:hypothetical protein
MHGPRFRPQFVREKARNRRNWNFQVTSGLEANAALVTESFGQLT